MVNQDIIAANSAFWRKKKEYLLWKYADIEAAIQDERRRENSTLQGCAESHLWSAFELLLLRYEAMAYQLLPVALEEAALALERNDFVLKFLRDTGIPLSEKELIVERAEGRASCYKSMFFAQWLLTGVYHPATLREAARWEREAYDVYYRKPFIAEACDELLLDLVMAGGYEAVAELYHRDYRKALQAVPTSLRYARSPLHVEYGVAQFLAGHAEYEPFVHGALQKYREYAQVWYYSPYLLLLFNGAEQLSWMYLYHQIVRGNADLSAILEDLRTFDLSTDLA